MITNYEQKSLKESLSNYFLLSETRKFLQTSKNPILADDVPPNEVSHVLFCDGGQGFSFYPFHEVVYAYYKELQLSYCYREWAHDV